MKLNINQKIVLIINLIEAAKTVYGPDYLPTTLHSRAGAVNKWLADNTNPESAESMAMMLGVELPPPASNEQYGAIQINEFEYVEGLTQLMEQVIAADLLAERIPEPEDDRPKQREMPNRRTFRRRGRRQ